jgi:hypothetical protein
MHAARFSALLRSGETPPVDRMLTVNGLGGQVRREAKRELPFTGERRAGAGMKKP